MQELLWVDVSGENQSMSAGVDAILPKLEHARRELLDLGLRNSLISYRALKSRGVEVVGESPVEVFRLLVRDGKRMSFAPAPESTTSQLPLDNDEQPVLPQPDEPSPDEVTTRQRDTNLQTAAPSEQLQRRLLNTFYAARTYVEEQGVSVLYLALGFLEWYETDTSADKRRAPLILVPVELERSNALDRFHLTYTGDEIGDNLSLAAKLRSEFNVEAPTLPEIEDLDVAAWYSDWEAAVVSRPRWGVDRTAIALGFFSFGKFLMYHDLDVSTWPDETRPTEQSIIGSLLSDAGFSDPPSAIVDDAFIDPFIKPEDVRQIVDADSSQTLAILDVNAGRNLVIQGPPGTGKSQTITNLIAEAIGAGRTILFVAEKMAALEVVKRRLDSTGLGDACLELHSNKINKRLVLNELRRTLELGKPKVATFGAELDLLESSRARLNAYCSAVNAPIGNSTLTPYDAYGELIRSRGLAGGDTWPRMEIPAMADWTDAEFNQHLAVVREFQARLAVMGTPVEHPFWGSRLTVVLPSDVERLRTELQAAPADLDTIRHTADELAFALGLPQPTRRAETQMALAAADRVLDAPDLSEVAISATEWSGKVEAIRALMAAGNARATIVTRHQSTLIPDAWDADLLPVRQDLAAYRDKWWRFFSGTYRGAKSTLAGYCTSGLPDGADAQIALIDDVLEARRQAEIVAQHSQLGQTLFGADLSAASTNWETTNAVSEWMIRLRADINAGSLPAETVTYLAGTPARDATRTASADVRSAQTAWSRRLTAIHTQLAFDDSRRFGADQSLADQPYASLASIIGGWTQRLHDIDQMQAFNASADICFNSGLDEVVRVAEGWPGGGLHLAAAFERGRSSVLLERALRDRSELATFDSTAHEEVIARFRELDVLTFSYNRARLALAHWQRLPQHEAGGQLGILRREFEKKSRHLPVRQLMDRAGNAVQAIKPIFMMSPLSVATFIPPGALTFDLVVFDEASQIKPVDAFGALARGRQAVVVGDDKQLPPTSFFDSIGSSDESEEDSTVTDIPSILGLFNSQSAPKRMLRWHYRSRHESLIAVSNHEFYESKLVVFPSPDHSREEAGLVFHHLPNTAYDRGGSRTNREEARIVAEAVMQHARETPKLTLGVAAFSNPQAEAIQHEVERLRREDPTCEPYFSAFPHEPFFVKNLENVQGDERDVIYISVGYGRTAEGYVAMNFGPLNADGGERRLNVLITRSRLRCEVFTNLTADDIDLNRTQARGVVAFKRFLAYARTGIMDIPIRSGRESGSPFEDAVADALRSHGYAVEGQVGSSGFFIDLAVVDPERPGRFLLGIECDGASYHSARSARDRDRLRQSVLEGLGWKIHRIWSTDWFRNPERELRRAIAAIEHAAAHGETTDVPRPVRLTTTIERTDSPAESTPAVGTPAYQRATLDIRLGSQQLHSVPTKRLADWIVEVIEIESPVHVEEVVRRVVSAAGISRAGSRIRAALDAAISSASLDGSINQRGPFLWSSTMTTPVVRDRSALDTRAMDLIAPEEIAAAIQLAIASAYGMEQSQVAAATGRLLGFSRLTEDVRSVVDPLVDDLIASGLLQRQGTQVVATGSGNLGPNVAN